jgi:hypothetical protein
MTAEKTRLPIVLICQDGSEVLWWPPTIPAGPIRLPVLIPGGIATKSFEMDVTADRLTYREKAVRA